MVPVLQHFGGLCAEFAGLVSDADAGSEDSRCGSDNEDYRYEYEDATQECGQPRTQTEQWLAEHAMKKKWEARERELREERRQQQSRKKTGNAESQSKRHKCDPDPFPDTMGSSATSTGANMFSGAASSKVLMNHLLSLMHSPTDLGYTVAPVGDDIHCWAVSMYGFHPSSELFTDLVMLDGCHGYHHVEIQLRFAMDLFPFYPPLVTIVRPRFEGYMLGRLANLPCLKLSQWDPLMGVERCIDNIRRVLEGHGRLVVDTPLNALSRNSSYIPLEHLLLQLGTVGEAGMRTQQRWEKEEEEQEEEEEEQEGDGRGGGEKTEVEADTTAADAPTTPAAASASASSSAGEVQTPKDASATWADGTGYGSGACSNAGNWDMAAYEAAQAEKDRLQAELLELVLEQIANTVEWSKKHKRATGAEHAEAGAIQQNGVEENPLLSMHALDDVLAESCLLPYLHGFVRTDSLLELGRHTAIHVHAFHVMEYLSSVEALQPLLLLPITTRGDALPVSIVSGSHALAARLATCLHSFASSEKSAASPAVSKLVKAVHQKTDSASATAKACGGATAAPAPALAPAPAPAPMSETALSELRSLVLQSGDTMACMQYISQVLQRLHALQKGTGIDTSMDVVMAVDAAGETLTKNPLSMSPEVIGDAEAAYAHAMRGSQYEEVEVLPNYHYVSKVQHPDTGGSSRERNKRLAQEHVDLAHSLPFSLSSAVWIRTSAERMDALQAMISGPDGTPYENGLFIFDAYFPKEYPTTACLVNLQTTGGGSVRFNPNLYNCGKVCLSLLGTWFGTAGENWSSQSTFLQVLVSIQSLILVPEPYFNEPGYEAEMHTAEGRADSRDYNRVIREATIMWGMLDQLRKPSKAFSAVITRHFSVKKAEIERQMERWCLEDEDDEEENESGQAGEGEEEEEKEGGGGGGESQGGGEAEEMITETSKSGCEKEPHLISKASATAGTQPKAEAQVQAAAEKREIPAHSTVRPSDVRFFSAAQCALQIARGHSFCRQFRVSLARVLTAPLHAPTYTPIPPTDATPAS